MTKFVNCTPHAIVITDGATYQPTGSVARVNATFSAFDADGICEQAFGEVQNLPDPIAGTVYIVSGMVLAANQGRRSDLVAPATGHPNVVRNEKGHIVSVPGFVKA